MYTRRSIFAFALPLSIAAQAQLVNGSFEMFGAPDLAGWEWTCATPGQPNDAAPGSGSWCITKEPGHAKGCFPSLVFQRIVNVNDGDLVTVSGWVRCDDFVFCLGAQIGLGTVNSGLFTLEESVGGSDFIWTFVSITDTVQLAAGDTAIVALTSGFIGGPIDPAPGYFDGISVQGASGIADKESGTLAHYLDPVTGLLHIDTRGDELLQADLLDLSGRTLQVPQEKTSASAVNLAMQGVPVGTYVVRVATHKGIRAFRFVAN